MKYFLPNMVNGPFLISPTKKIMKAFEQTTNFIMTWALRKMFIKNKLSLFLDGFQIRLVKKQDFYLISGGKKKKKRGVLVLISLV